MASLNVTIEMWVATKNVKMHDGYDLSLPVIVDPPFNCMIHATGKLLHIPIGKAGKKVTMHDIISAFHEVSLHEELLKCRKSGSAFYHEGFFVSGKTLFMHWGS